MQVQLSVPSGDPIESSFLIPADVCESLVSDTQGQLRTEGSSLSKLMTGSSQKTGNRSWSAACTRLRFPSQKPNTAKKTQP